MKSGCLDKLIARISKLGPEDVQKALIRLVQELRTLDVRKKPSIAETIDWAKTLLLMHAKELGGDLVRDTLNVLLKFEEDIQTAEQAMPQLLKAARDEGLRV